MQNNLLELVHIIASCEVQFNLFYSLNWVNFMQAKVLSKILHVGSVIMLRILCSSVCVYVCVLARVCVCGVCIYRVLLCC